MVSSFQLAPIYPVVHRVLKPLFPSCLWAGSDHDRVVALTFDDGPHPEYTPKLLQVLDRYNVQANFFLLGACVERSPEVTKAIYESGHWIGLHGYHHRSFPTLSEMELKHALQRTQAVISDACQLAPDDVLDVRPPNGLFTPKTLSLLTQWNYRPVMWSVVPEDWMTPGITTVVNRVLQQVRNGSIIVLHDGYCGGADVAEVANQLIPCLQEQGYKFCFVDHFWQQSP